MNHRTILFLFILMFPLVHSKEDELSDVLADLAAGAVAGLIQNGIDDCYSNPICKNGDCVCTKVFSGMFFVAFLAWVLTVFAVITGLCSGHIKPSQLLPTCDDVGNGIRRGLTLSAGHSLTRDTHN